MLLIGTPSKAVSTLGWVDQGAVWVCAAGEKTPRKIVLSDAKWLSPARGSDDCFAVVHHWDDKKLEITAHSSLEVTRVICRLALQSGTKGEPSITWQGELSVWTRLPRAFVAYVYGDYHLILIRETGEVELQTFEWFDSSYDKGYQGIIGVTEVPDSNLLIVSVQRDSAPVLYDPTSRQAIRKLRLAGRMGNPDF